MIALLLGFGLGHATPALLSSGPSDAFVRAAPQEDDRHRRRGVGDTRPGGKVLEMGPAATGFSMLALLVALFVRARRRRASD